MNSLLYTINTTEPCPLDDKTTDEATTALEQAKVVYFPKLTFNHPFCAEPKVLSEAQIDARHKNISYNMAVQRLGKLKKTLPDPEIPQLLTQLLHDYALFAKTLVEQTIPAYRNALIWGRTSFRPAKIDTRVSSKRKDDTRLHVDSFSASPVYGKRILRVFTNINPFNEPRVWHLGEPFEDVLARFAPHIPNYHYLVALFLKTIQTTKTLRSAYDHYQIYLHDRMKRDDQYQQTVPKQQIDFPAHSTWMVYTDQVSHAALSGQFLLEQTFYLPITAMRSPDLSPLKQWEKVKNIVIPHH